MDLIKLCDQCESDRTIETLTIDHTLTPGIVAPGANANINVNLYFPFEDSKKRIFRNALISCTTTSDGSYEEPQMIIQLMKGTAISQFEVSDIPVQGQIQTPFNVAVTRNFTSQFKVLCGGIFLHRFQFTAGGVGFPASDTIQIRITAQFKGLM